MSLVLWLAWSADWIQNNFNNKLQARENKVILNNILKFDYNNGN